MNSVDLVRVASDSKVSASKSHLPCQILKKAIKESFKIYKFFFVFKAILVVWKESASTSTYLRKVFLPHMNSSELDC